MRSNNLPSLPLILCAGAQDLPFAKPSAKKKVHCLQVEFKEDENVAFSDEVRAFLLKDLSNPKEASPWSSHV